MFYIVHFFESLFLLLKKWYINIKVQLYTYNMNFIFIYIKFNIKELEVKKRFI